MSQRKKIRKKIIELLKGNTGAKENVSSNRINPIDDQDGSLPYISVTIRTEPVAEHNTAPRSLLRRPNIDIEIFDEGNTEEQLSDRLDDLAEQVEDILNLNATVNDIDEWDDLILTDEVQIDVEFNGQQYYGSVVMTFQAKYVKDTISSSAAESQVTDDLNKIVATFEPTTAPSTTELDENMQSEIDFPS